MPYQTAKDMIDTTALTALITAFRAEVTQNSISPEKVGSILQQIADLLATAAPGSRDCQGHYPWCRKGNEGESRKNVLRMFKARANE